MKHVALPRLQGFFCGIHDAYVIVSIAQFLSEQFVNPWHEYQRIACACGAVAEAFMEMVA